MAEGGNPRFITAAEVAENYAPIGSGGGIGGSIADKQVAFGSGTDITGSDNLLWDEAELKLGIGQGDGDIQYDQNSTLRINGGRIGIGNGLLATAGNMVLPKTFTVKALNFAGDGNLDVLSVGIDGNNVVTLGDISAEYIELDPAHNAVAVGASEEIDLIAPIVAVSGTFSATAIVFPDSDPHVAGAAYWVAGVLTKSAG